MPFQWKFSLIVILLEVIFLVLFLIFVRYDLETASPKPIKSTNVTKNENDTVASRNTFIDFLPHFDAAFLDNETKLYLSHLAHSHHHQKLNSVLENRAGQHVEHYYSVFQDVHIIVFIGIGFLMTFLKRYGFSSVGFNFLIGAFAIQWQTLVHAFINFLHDPTAEMVVRINIESMIKADFSAAAVLISFGVVLGKTSPLQLIIMALFEIVFFEANDKIFSTQFHATDVGDSMIVHVFAAYFGLAVSRVLYKRDIEEAENKEGSVYQSDLFSMIGTVFLFICWPSFNAATAEDEGRVRAVVNTYFSLTGSVVMAFALSSLVNAKGKFQMEHIQNSSLAGGVAIGTLANLVIQPGAALAVGMVAGAVSVLGFHFLSPLLFRKLRVHDTCGVHNLHGIPGMISAVGSIIAVLFATPELYQSNYSGIFGDPVRSPTSLAAMQAATLALTLVFAIGGGVITGFVMRLAVFEPPSKEGLFDDEDFWLIPIDASLHIAEKAKNGLLENA